MKKLVFILFALITANCTHPREYAEMNGLTQGTTYHIVVETYQGLDISDLRQKVESLLADVDHSLSIYNDTSVISLINSNKSDLTDTLFRDVFRASALISEQSGGLFDITIGPLVEAWGFGPDAMKRFDPAKLDSLLALVGMNKVRLQGERLVKSSPAMFIDVNAIAQGYTVDLLVRMLQENRIRECLVEVGGEVRTVGNKGDIGWRVGIDRPADGNNSPGEDLEAIIRLDNSALATSGNYRKFYIENGVKYSHTIDPHTGYPARHTILSASVVAPDCTTADAWATACMVAGKDSAIYFIEKYDYLEGYLVFSDESGAMKTWMSEGLRNKIEER